MKQIIGVALALILSGCVSSNRLLLVAVFVALALILSGCVSNAYITPEATGGSKADGMVELSYELTEFQRPIINEAAALEKALKRCQSWGYSKAERFGGQRSQCNLFGGFSGCARQFITLNYQCMD